jgi:hypothetical protein
MDRVDWRVETQHLVEYSYIAAEAVFTTHQRTAPSGR